MRNRFWGAAAATAFLILFPEPVRPCTTMVVTPGASADGSMIVTHSDDNEMADQRLVYVPARDWPAGALRPVYASASPTGDLTRYNTYEYPRLVDPDRAAAYATAGFPRSVPLGFIPQVSHTYAYFDGIYGIMNEHQLMFGECTSGSKTDGTLPEAGKRIFYSAELSRVALERCRTAREAVDLMGELIDEYGFWGTGETLPVADPEEAWVMEMCPSPEGTGGLWVARKIPDGEVFAAANEFRIREIDPDDSGTLYSRNLFDVARRQGWWRPEDGPLDWLKAASLGEYNHPYYSLRRVWRIQDRIAPSLKLGPWVENGFTRAYPFTVKPDRLLSVREVMDLYRDHYEGTEFDMTVGMAAGPFGNPYRYFGPYDRSGDTADPSARRQGAWERSISVYYQGYVTVCQGRRKYPDPIGGICWYGADRGAETCYVPFFAGVTAVPEPFWNYTPWEFQPESAWWIFNFVSNWSTIKYSYMIKDIEQAQEELESGELSALAAAEPAALDLYRKNPEQACAYLTDFCSANAAQVLAAWKRLAGALIGRYSDGFVNEKDTMAQEVGYPRWWRDRVGYENGPITYARPQQKQ
ncbi:MAG TPA: C69 family dipeptidase [bacterium]|mgnify:CR=1 FL=1|nr:C69 family dipeptidase [bacterium]HPJ71471.1 C69 family dipeptidase [bacterium]HPQ66028.1 C69 family dipeptidase [bacterium]